MSQRPSGWERKAWDLYETPAWCTEALIPHLPWLGGSCWEPAAGSGKMVEVLSKYFDSVLATDAQQDESFFDFTYVNKALPYRAIITNPPYDQAQKFAEHALELMRPRDGVVALLLRIDFDSAKTRAHLFEHHQAWWKKLVFRKRIMWFKGEKSPSYNHAFYIWNWQHDGSPATIAYGPKE